MKRNLFYMAALTLVLVGCSENDTTEKKSEAEKNGTAFVGTIGIKTGENPLTRTSFDYDRAGRKLTYYWEPSDKIFLDDNNSATTELTAKAARASFVFETGTYNAANYTVYYTGKNGIAYNNVTIATTQTQTTPNSTEHIGASGDCGTGTATRNPNHTYAFTLNHKSSYLCFLPRTTNAVGTGWVLTSIKVTSDNNIAGNYTLSATGLSGAGSSNTITLNTTDFDITNSATDQDKNAAYMVIAPGTHALTVEYNVKNTVTGNTGTIKKTLASKAYDANTIYPVTAHLFEDFSGTKYYLWDAEQDMWFGKTAIDYNTGAYAGADCPQQFTPADANRWFNASAPILPGFTITFGYGTHFFYATRSAKDCPNVFELAWYFDKGDIRWDGVTAFAFRGAIFHGGAWIKKQQIIANENHIAPLSLLKSTYPGVQNDPQSLVNPDGGISADGPRKPIGQGMPSAADINKYFYVPALGQYSTNVYSQTTSTLTNLGTSGYYTCSNAYTLDNNYQWVFTFNNTELHLNSIDFLKSGVPLWKAK